MAKKNKDGKLGFGKASVDAAGTTKPDRWAVRVALEEHKRSPSTDPVAARAKILRIGLNIA